MARQLTLSLDGNEFAVSLVKIDRDKLYGTIEVEAFDEKGREASLLVLAADGKTFLDKGGTALATINDKGTSVDRAKLIPVGENGDKIEPVPSSFNAPNVLTRSDADEYLSQITKSVYLLLPPEDGDLSLLLESLADDQIYTFPFSYRGGVENDDAFILGNDGDAYMIVGKKANIRFVKLNQAGVLESEEEEEISADELDFNLL